MKPFPPKSNYLSERDALGVRYLDILPYLWHWWVERDSTWYGSIPECAGTEVNVYIHAVPLNVLVSRDRMNVSDLSWQHVLCMADFSAELAATRQ